jgi:hypothetical protein
MHIGQRITKLAFWKISGKQHDCMSDESILVNLVSVKLTADKRNLLAAADFSLERSKT